MKSLIKAAKQGNQKAIKQLYNTTRDRAYFIASRYLKPADVEDILQEAYMAAFTKLDTFDESKTFPAWLYKIVNNKCIDWLRKKGIFFSMMNLFLERFLMRNFFHLIF